MSFPILSEETAEYEKQKQKNFFRDFPINVHMTISLSIHHCIRISIAFKTKNSALRKSFQMKHYQPVPVYFLLLPWCRCHLILVWLFLRLIKTGFF